MVAAYDDGKRHISVTSVFKNKNFLIGILFSDKLVIPEQSKGTFLLLCILYVVGIL